jgi:hypothetical protein
MSASVSAMRLRTLVIARSASDEAIQSGIVELDCFAPLRCARNDKPFSRRAFAPELCKCHHVKREEVEQRRKQGWCLPWFFA